MMPSLTFIKNGSAMNLNVPNENELQMIEELGATGFSPGEIAEVLQVDKALFLSAFRDEDGSIYKTFRKGYLLGQLKLRQRIAKDAEHGSSPAQTLLKKIYDECDYQLKQL